ncbi:MAG: AgmX/PglI C-terminal domain-containing protein [Myxococcaceae bacterium]|nr:AgmX/PglI C-terminal domain-containing protein [Myxococcaceae bacterium]
MGRRLLPLLVVAFVALCGVGLWLTKAPPRERATRIDSTVHDEPTEPTPRPAPRPAPNAPAAAATTPGPAELAARVAKDAGVTTDPSRVQPSPAAPMPAPLVGGHTRPAPAAPPYARGGLDERAIRTAIDSVKPLIRQCFEDAADRFPPPQKVTLRFTVIGQSLSGHFDDGEIQSSTIVDPWVQSCFLDALTDARFPVPEGGGKATVSWPFSFTKEAADGGEERW